MPGIPSEAYTAEAKAWATRFTTRFGQAPEAYTIEGYLGMQLILDSLEEACTTSLPTDREAVRRAALQTKDRSSILGTYRLDEFGDASIAAVAAYKVSGGEVAFHSIP
jgi:branched-chain amino acid transport system substrate-binding protein